MPLTELYCNLEYENDDWNMWFDLMEKVKPEGNEKSLLRDVWTDCIKPKGKDEIHILVSQYIMDSIKQISNIFDYKDIFPSLFSRFFPKTLNQFTN